MNRKDSIKIRESFRGISSINEDIFKQLGYEYSIMEGGYISGDLSTIIIIDRMPYNGMVLQFRPNSEEEYNKHVERLKKKNVIK
ncbi:hypothetical protein [Oceanobacillus oncorhynchi]|uniref:hypothetical protein n=1 Tax=Oceanobacillus oncorhynchi TaxID=545501 RepID=UPI0018666214|nr:hypothetical protein [Oceanobacillus oncorhynchi]